MSLAVTINILEYLHRRLIFKTLHDFLFKLCSVSDSRYVNKSAFTMSNSHDKFVNDMLGSCIRIVATEINIGILELVQKNAFIK